MMGIGFPELMIILVIIMIIFGAGKLPEIGSAFGRSIKNFKQSMKEAEAAEGPDTETATEEVQEGTTSEATASDGTDSVDPKTAQDAKKKEEEIIDEAALEIKENRIGTIRTAHDGLVQQNDVFTESMKRTPGGRGRNRGVSRDVF
jgi:TatA/E family protein of Tat protein translocase